MYSITSTDPLDIPTIRRLVPGGQVQHRTSAGGRVPGVVQLRSPLGDLISDDAIAREMDLARPTVASARR